MVILSGILHLEDWTTKAELEDNIPIVVSDTDYSNNGLYLEWLKDFKRQVGIYHILLLNRYRSHCT
ncbi:hypothetical protein L873DRAFT_1865674 [Choiromyces venosus 120613-1]|uniref:DDE-1 domain-containing protein n=1 Tax=Choiromyces venosus 120613-1 TaxID=1336337 RepID=A0A3N4J3V7_9PEZI|nr:hypothetical protein L873DRAFT_1865674 [Choiromyces venosus 120613-1]